MPDWDLPDLPLPDLPAIPSPDWELPGWAREVLDSLKLVVPVIIAFVLARAEIRRRRQQDELRRDRESASESDQ